jgi:hypothetical protein
VKLSGGIIDERISKRSHDPLKLLVNTITVFEDRSESLADSLQAFRSLDVHGVLSKSSYFEGLLVVSIFKQPS